MLENEVSYRYIDHFFTCMPKGLHAPRCRIWFQGRLFPPNKTYILIGGAYLFQVTKKCISSQAK